MPTWVTTRAWARTPSTSSGGSDPHEGAATASATARSTTRSRRVARGNAAGASITRASEGEVGAQLDAQLARDEFALEIAVLQEPEHEVAGHVVAEPVGAACVDGEPV